jgi:hypothetical protein
MIVTTVGEARALAEERLAWIDSEAVILDENTVETDFGWIFFWNSKRYLEPGDYRDTLAGNVPLIVDRANSSVHETCTFLPIEEIINRYRTVRGTLGTASFAQALFVR